MSYVVILLGLLGLSELLNTDLSRGLSPVDLQKREEHFGTNKKKAATVIPFYKLFFGALDDFMLKLLLVCAVVDLAIQTGFA